MQHEPRVNSSVYASIRSQCVPNKSVQMAISGHNNFMIAITAFLIVKYAILAGQRDIIITLWETLFILKMVDCNISSCLCASVVSLTNECVVLFESDHGLSKLDNDVHSKLNSSSNSIILSWNDSTRPGIVPWKRVASVVYLTNKCILIIWKWL